MYNIEGEPRIVRVQAGQQKTRPTVVIAESAEACVQISDE
jgi:hypothetical protein